jgi:putative endonuclease
VFVVPLLYAHGMSTRIDLGRRGEDAAARLYESLGYEIVVRNLRLPGGELDLVARRGAELVFCEVKTRSTGRFGEPSHAVNYAKRARIRRLAAAWLSANRMWGHEIRFDVVSVVARRGDVSVTHLIDAF